MAIDNITEIRPAKKEPVYVCRVHGRLGPVNSTITVDDSQPLCVKCYMEWMNKEFGLTIAHDDDK